MNIVIFGAGAIGSLFGALLSKKNKVILIGRKPHVKAICRNGLTIDGKTKLNVKVAAADSVDKVDTHVDLLILTVKSYDTETSIKQAKSIVSKNTVVISIQNGLGNIDGIKKFVNRGNIIAGVTTHGVFFSKPGVIKHTGKGTTILGELNGSKTKRIDNIVNIFSRTGIETFVSEDILKEIWIKAIVNSCINPLTTFFQCKNGYLLENPVLEKILEKICEESTSIANAYGIDLASSSMIQKTKEVVKDTYENHSSMLQSILQGKKTEIESINGRIVEVGRKHNAKTLMNEILVYSIESMCED